MNINEMLKKINEFDVNKRHVIGIDGLSRSGKTTIVEEVRQCLEKIGRPFYSFHIDDHIVTRKERYNTGLEQWYEYYQLQWDTKWLADNFFSKLSKSVEIVLPYYQDEFDTQIKAKVVLPENGIILIEGVFLQREEWKKFFDFMIYLDCPREVRFRRESIETQKNVSKFRERYWKAEDYYLRKVQPKENVDILIVSD